jgi:hypothetical protein
MNSCSVASIVLHWSSLSWVAVLLGSVRVQEAVNHWLEQLDLVGETRLEFQRPAVGVRSTCRRSMNRARPAAHRHAAVAAGGCHACSRPCPWPRAPQQTRSWALWQDRSDAPPPVRTLKQAARESAAVVAFANACVYWSLLLHNLLCIYYSHQAHLQNAFHC